MTSRLLVSLAPVFLLAVAGPLPAAAEVGTWTGQFKSVHINFTTAGTSGGYRPSEASKDQKPEVITSEVTITVEAEQDGLIYGGWSAKDEGSPGAKGGHFVCAETSSERWNCVDRTGVTIVTVLPGGGIRACHLETSKAGQLAGCGDLAKTQ